MEQILGHTRKRRLEEYVPHKRKRISNEALLAYLFVGLPIIGYIFFHIFPLALSFIMQFCEMDMYDLKTLQWNNFANFKQVYTDPNFWLSIGVSFIVSTNQFISLLIALIIGLLMNKKPWGRKVFQVIYFIPYICSSVAVSLMWKRMFNEDYGVINTLITNIFGEGNAIKWYNSKAAYPWMLIIASAWGAPGYGIVMYKAALNAVNPTLYEAADVDGANAFKKLFHITLPAIAPTTFFLLMAGIINGLQTFDLAYQFGGGGNWQRMFGPGNIGLTTVVYIYQWGTEYQNMPVAAVMSWALFVVIFTATLINFILRKKWVDE